MSRKITDAAIAAFYSGQPFRSSNTFVAHSTADGPAPAAWQGSQDEWRRAPVARLYLHGASIARYTLGYGLEIRTCGFPSRTTRERLCGLPGIRAWQMDRVQHVQVGHAPGVPWREHADYLHVGLIRPGYHDSAEGWILGAASLTGSHPEALRDAAVAYLARCGRYLDTFAYRDVVAALAPRFGLA